MEASREQTPGGSSPLGRAGGFVAAHSQGALVLIVILLVALVALYAYHKGWLGGGSSKTSRRRKSKTKDDDDEDEDADGSTAETDRLIQSINSAASAPPAPGPQ